MEPSDVSRLIGAGPGLVSAGNMVPIHRIAQVPWPVIVCKSIDKCHPIIRDLVEGALREGFFTDGVGKKVYISDAIFIMTASTLSRSARRIGFNGAGTINARDETKIRLQSAEILGKEFIKSIDLFFTADERITDIRRRQWLKENLLYDLTVRFADKGINIYWEESIIQELVRRQGETDDVGDWESLVNSWLMPTVITTLNAEKQPRALTIGFDNDEIIVEITDAASPDLESSCSISDEQKKIFNSVLVWLAECFRVKLGDADSHVKIVRRNKSAEIFVYEWRNKLLITIQARVARAAEQSEELAHFLLQKNLGLRFGKFAVETDGTIVLEHTLSGANCDRKVLLMAIDDIWETESKLSAEIVSRLRPSKRKPAILIR
ncbi:MAG: YbjN domain-containing protein [Chloracidobacterium sp.]|nr:YbjN domain-containing protein [Chloracidobacterium sp.]